MNISSANKDGEKEAKDYQAQKFEEVVENWVSFMSYANQNPKKKQVKVPTWYDCVFVHAFT